MLEYSTAFLPEDGQFSGCGLQKRKSLHVPYPSLKCRALTTAKSLQRNRGTEINMLLSPQSL